MDISSPVRHAATLLRAALDLALPPACAACDSPIPAPGLLCAGCFAATSFITGPVCAACGGFLPHPRIRPLPGLRRRAAALAPGPRRHGV